MVAGLVVTGCVVEAAVVLDGGAVVEATVVLDGGAVVDGAVVVATVVVVDTFEVVVRATGFVAAGLLDEPFPAPAIPATTSTSTTGIAILAHSGQALTRSSRDLGPDAAITGITAVSDHTAVGTGSVGAADSGGYHLPSDATHQPGSFGR